MDAFFTLVNYSNTLTTGYIKGKRFPSYYIIPSFGTGLHTIDSQIAHNGSINFLLHNKLPKLSFKPWYYEQTKQKPYIEEPLIMMENIQWEFPMLYTNLN